MAGLLALAWVAGCVSAAPFTAHATVNGVDPTVDVAVVSPGEKAEVRIRVDVESDDVVVTGIEFASSPGVMGEILNDFVDGEVELPERLQSGEHVESYDLPGVMPAGEYNLVARVRYTGDGGGVEEYECMVRVESTGFVSMVLGLLVRVLPGFMSKPVVKMFI